MTGIIEMLPFLNGWKYILIEKDVNVPVNISNLEAYSEDIQGWLINAALFADDAFATLNVTFPPTDLNLTQTIFDVYAEGRTVPPSSGFFVPLFTATSITSSSVGTFIMDYNTYPLPLPKKSKFRVSLSLLGNTLAFSAGAINGSTQLSSNMAIALILIKVVDEIAFINSYKENFLENKGR